ncbi:hypothetical protein F5Y19DRAFT_441359 [Xylariaceae sp. FL1651]|nr:hypothetical protein F5Y19DRAFT_441359 [Xylariaceae sp. FL1651]
MRPACCAICGCLIPAPSAPLALNAGAPWGWQCRAVLLSDPDREFDRREVHYRAGKLASAPPLDFQRASEIRKDAAFVVSDDRVRLISPRPKRDRAGNGGARPGEGAGDKKRTDVEADGVGEAEGEAEVEMETEVKLNGNTGHDENGNWNSHYYIAVHEACLVIAERLFASVARSDNRVVGGSRVRIRSVEALWKALRMRFDARDNEFMGTVFQMPAGPSRINLPNGYYLPADWSTADPMHVEDLTLDILNNLKDLPAPGPRSPRMIDFQDMFWLLPQELQDHVQSFLLDESLPVECTGLLPQHVWRDILFQGKCFPFLWDADYEAVEAFCLDSERIGQLENLNWELFVRKLSNEIWDIDNRHATTLKIPKGLRNRRRIWQLVADMYVCDVVPRQLSSIVVAIPRYWDERGNPLYPVERISQNLHGSNNPS